MAFKDLDGLDLCGLVDRLGEIRETRTDIGFNTESAIVKTSLERRILEVVCGEEDSDASIVEVEPDVEIEIHNRTYGVDAAQVRAGGLVLHGVKTPMVDGSPVVVKVRTDTNFALKAKGVARCGDGDLRISFKLDGAGGRRAEKLILELLKHPTRG